MKKTEKRLQEIYNEITSMNLPMEREFAENDFNSLIVVGFLPGAPIDKMIGRIVQMRKEWGCFGSNQIFLRGHTHTLYCHENQWYYKVPKLFIDELNEIFKDTPTDEKNMTYSLGGKFKRKGFIVKSKVKEGQTTPMREVRKDIAHHINEVIKRKG